MSMTRRRLLDDTFKKTVEGNPAIATDSLARMYPGIVMNGWTTQDGTPTPETPVPIVSAGTQNQETGKYEVEVEVGGGNLFDISKSENNKILYTGGTTRKDPLFATSDYIPGIPGTQHSRTIKGATGNFFYDDQKQYTSVVNGSLFTLPENAKYVRFSYNIVEDDSYKEIMLNPGANLLPYEPYRPPQSVTLTSDRPLTKWDRLEKRNGQWGWVYKSNEVVLDGSEDEKWNKSQNQNAYNVEIEDIGQKNDMAIYSNLFIGKSFNDRNFTKNNTAFSSNINEYPVRIIFIKTDINDIDSWKTWLSSNPITVLYQTAAETFAPLTSSEQEAMNALHTYRPTTVLTNQQGCQMTLTYKTRKGMS